jgi:lipase chaperone LimK
VLGEAAARRLQQVDQAQAQWNEKYQNYRDQREQLASDGLSDTAFNEELVRLQEMLFEPQEVRRVQALDRLNTDKK